MFGLPKFGIQTIRIRFFEENNLGEKNVIERKTTNVRPRTRTAGKRKVTQEFFKEFHQR
jgi:hypothetical protein